MTRCAARKIFISPGTLCYTRQIQNRDFHDEIARVSRISAMRAPHATA
jgi:hypothetical protein